MARNCNEDRLKRLIAKVAEYLQGKKATRGQVELAEMHTEAELVLLELQPTHPALADVRWKVEQNRTPLEQVPLGASAYGIGAGDLDQYRTGLTDCAHRLKDLLDTALRIATKPDERPRKKPPARGMSRDHRLRAVSRWVQRARTVAKLIEELICLHSRMTPSQSDYEALRKEHPNFLTFKICDRHPELKEKVLYLEPQPRGPRRLAQELAAAHYGRKLSTIQADWKKHKPAKYRRRQ
jgi:hypothetical protein